MKYLKLVDGVKSNASGFEYNQSYTDTLYEELSRDIHYILEHIHGSNVSDVSSEIIEE